jgi:hypothetical protein
MERCDIEEWSKAIVTERVTADGCICESPAFIFHLAIASDSNGAATATIYNGSSPKAEQKIDMTTIDDYYSQHDYWPPMFFSRGIYVDVGSNVSSVIVRYHSHKQ